MNAPALLCLMTLAAPQAPDDVLAHYRRGDKDAVVTRTDVALEMAFHLRRRSRGQDACEMLVDAALTRRAAEKQNLMPTPEEAKAFWRQLQDQLRAAGRRPEEFAAVRNTSEEQWLADLAVQMAQERLVRAELRLRKNEPVSGDMLKLWLAEAKKQTEVVTDADQLPPGTAARVGERVIAAIDLGMLLLRTAEDDERERFVRQFVYLERLEDLGRELGVEVGPADLDRAIEERRQDAARDPRYRGASFESMLQAEGLSVQSLRELRVFRAQVLLDKIAHRRFPTETLEAELAAERQAVLDLVGPRRRIGIVFVRALKEPNALITRDFDAAATLLERAHKRLATDSFATVAAIESEHGPSKTSGGDVGWHRRRSDALPDPVLAAAFALPLGAVSMPVRADNGVYLVTAFEIEPEPTEAQLLERLRDHRAQELGEQLLERADIRFAGREAAKDR
jgi:hypothetical protein